MRSPHLCHNCGAVKRHTPCEYCGYPNKLKKSFRQHLSVLLNITIMVGMLIGLIIFILSN